MTNILDSLKKSNNKQGMMNKNLTFKSSLSILGGIVIVAALVAIIAPKGKQAPTSNISRTPPAAQTNENINSMEDIKAVRYLTKKGVKQILGVPSTATDAIFTYKTIQPDTGKMTSCYIFFDAYDSVKLIKC